MAKSDRVDRKKEAAERIVEACYMDDLGVYILQGLMHPDEYAELYDDKEALIEAVSRHSAKELKVLSTQLNRIQPLAHTFKPSRDKPPYLSKEALRK